MQIRIADRRNDKCRAICFQQRTRISFVCERNGQGALCYHFHLPMQQQRTHAVTFAAEIILSEFRRPGQKTGLNPFTALGKDLYTRSRSGAHPRLHLIFLLDLRPLNILYIVVATQWLSTFFVMHQAPEPAAQFQCFLSSDCTLMICSWKDHHAMLRCSSGRDGRMRIYYWLPVRQENTQPKVLEPA